MAGCQNNSSNCDDNPSSPKQKRRRLTINQKLDAANMLRIGANAAHVMQGLSDEDSTAEEELDHRCSRPIASRFPTSVQVSGIFSEVEKACATYGLGEAAMYIREAKRVFHECRIAREGAGDRQSLINDFFAPQ